MAEPTDYVQEDPTTNPFLWAQQQPSPYYTPGQRIARSGFKGLTLGAGGQDIEPTGFVEKAAEFVGGAVPITALSVAATPAVGAVARFARLAPLSPGATALASNLAVDTTLAGIDTFTRDRPFVEGLATNVAMSAAGHGAIKGFAKLRGVSKEADNLDALAKATTTQVPDLPPVRDPEQFYPPLQRVTPPSAQFGPNISRDVTGPSNRVPLHNYVEFVDEYGKPINMAPETRLSTPSVQLDEYGNPRAVDVAVSPEELARRQAAPPPVQPANILGPTNINRFAEAPPRDPMEFYPPLQQVDKKLTSQFDPRLNTHVLTPKDPEVDKVVQNLHDSPSPRQTEVQFDPAQQKYLNSPNAEPLNNKLADVTKKQQEQSTDNLLKKSEEEIQKVVDTQEPAKVIDVVEMKKTAAAKRVDEITKRTGLAEPEVLQIVKQAEQEAEKLPFQNQRAKELGVAIRIERLIQERCR